MENLKREVDWVERLGQNHNSGCYSCKQIVCECHVCESKSCDCKFKFPTLKMFQEGGIFSHIVLPFSEDQTVPEELLAYIWGKHYDEGGNIRLEHTANIKESINEMFYNSKPSVMKNEE